MTHSPANSAGSVVNAPVEGSKNIIFFNELPSGDHWVRKCWRKTRARLGDGVSGVLTARARGSTAGAWRHGAAGLAGRQGTPHQTMDGPANSACEDISFSSGFYFLSSKSMT